MGALVRGKDFCTGLVFHEFDMNGIAVIVVQHEHVGVASTRGGEKTAGLVSVDLARDALVGGKDMVGSARRRSGSGRTKVLRGFREGMWWECGWGRQWLGQAEIGALLVEVAFYGGRRQGRILAHLLRGDVGEGGESAGIDGSTPGGERGREEGSMYKGNAVGDGGVGNEGVCGGRALLGSEV
jgi:hypothetical protein